jgi:TonB family protein
MTTLFAVTSSQVLALVAGLAVSIGLVIGLGRFMMRQKFVDLTQKNKNTDFKSTIRTRTKYPAVDVFRYSGTITLAGLAATLFLILVLVSWTTYDEQEEIQTFDVEMDAEVVVEPPRTAEPPPPPPPPPPPVIEEVPDEMIVDEEEIDYMDQSIEAESVVEAPPVEVAVAKVAPPPPPPEEYEDEIFKVVEQMPRFPGCEDMGGTSNEKKFCAEQKLYKFIYDNIKYPLLARETGVQGSVVVSFVINKDGSVEQIKILRDPGAGCGDEAKRVVKLMTEKNIKWMPGKQRGKPVRVQFILPIKFALA